VTYGEPAALKRVLFQLATADLISARASMRDSIWVTLLKGALAGAAGVAVMTVGEKLEQAVTKRPNSYVPAHTLERLLGLPTRPDSQRLWLN
jgi:hypothetical protein